MKKLTFCLLLIAACVPPNSYVSEQVVVTYTEDCQFKLRCRQYTTVKDSQGRLYERKGVHAEVGDTVLATFIPGGGLWQ